MAHLGKEEPIFNIMYIEKIWNTKVYTSKPETSNRNIPRERFLDPPVPPSTPLLSILYMGLTGSVLT